MPRAGAAAPMRRTPVPPPRLHRDESPDRRGGKKGFRQPEGPGKGETGSRKRRREEGRSTRTPPRHFAPGWGEVLPSLGDVNFFYRAEGGVLISRWKIGPEGFSRQGQAGSGMRRRGNTRLGAALAPRDAEGIALCLDGGGTESRGACTCSSGEFGVR